MNLINYTLTLIVSFLGLILGIILAYIAKEELKPGKKYFILLQKVILTSIVAFLFFYWSNKNIFLFIICLFASFILIYFFIEKIKTHHIYKVLGLIFYFSSKDIEIFKIQAFLIFLYGLPTGSLLTKVTKRNYFRVILNHTYFIIIALLSFFIEF